MKIQKLKRIFPKMKDMSGFTMIELLVVIAIIGILAVAVLSSINPIEQINKGRDTRLRSNAAQLINASDRFYAIQEIYPWNDATFTGLADDSIASVAVPTTTDVACPAGTNASFCKIGGPDYLTPLPWLTALSETQEVKQSFVDSLEDDSSSNGLYLIKLDGAVSIPTGEDSDLHICFLPSSKQFQLEALDACEGGTAPTEACPQEYPATDWLSEMICLP